MGSGFFISEDIMFTCAHVIDDAIKITFTVPGQEKIKYKAELVSVCFDKDIAVLRSVDYRSPVFMEFGDSDEVKMGDNVAALGYPVASQSIKSSGGKVSGRQSGMIQHHVPINEGNSGGPLVNDDMKVIGINSAKMVSTSVEGISYSIPINDVLAMKSELFNPTHSDKVIYEPSLLIKIQETDDNVRMFFGYKKSNGVVISTILEESPLYKVGVRQSDILISINGHVLDGSGYSKVKWSEDTIHLDDIQSTFSVDQTLPIQYYSVRSRKLRDVTITFDKTLRVNIRNIYYPYQKVDYEVLGGLVLVDLNHSHITNIMDASDISFANKLNIINYGLIENCNKRRVLLSDIINGSKIQHTYELSPGLFVENVNGTNVECLDDIRRVFNNGFKKKGQLHIYMRFSNGKQIILNTKELLEEDIELAEIYKYNISSLLADGTDHTPREE